MMAGGRDQLVHEGEVNFAKPLARALLRDARLSWGARGLFAFLWDLPGGWRPNVQHIAKMGRDGRDAVRARLAELEEVGALRIEPIRVEGGQLAGKRWVLVAPERWARESQLTAAATPESAPGEDSTEERVSRSSVGPKIGKRETKVLQNKGSPRKRPPPAAPSPPHHLVGVGEADLAELRQALIAEGRASGKRQPDGWAAAAVRRIRKDGADLDDLALLDRWRASKAAEAAHSARRDQPPPGMALASSAHSPATKSIPPADWAAPVR